MPAMEFTPEMYQQAMQQLQDIEAKNPVMGKLLRARLEKMASGPRMPTAAVPQPSPTTNDNVTHMLSGRVASAMQEAQASRAETAELRAQVNQLLSVTTQLTNTINQLRADLGDSDDDAG